VRSFRSIKILSLALVAVSTITVVGQQPSPEQLEQQAVARIDALTATLTYRLGDRVDEARYMRDLQTLTEQLQTQIDRFIQSAVKPEDTANIVTTRLERLLHLHRSDPAYSSPPLARVANLSAGRALLVAYTIARPPHFEAGTIRGYRSGLNGYELIATTGKEFGEVDGFNMKTREMPSPLTGEIWLLAYGQQHTANGDVELFRLYAFDGQQFRTVWSPDVMYSPEISFNGSAFTIEHLMRDRTQKYMLHDEFLITTNGVINTQSREVG
jgi:hypothetical protein